MTKPTTADAVAASAPADALLPHTALLEPEEAAVLASESAQTGLSKSYLQRKALCLMFGLDVPPPPKPGRPAQRPGPEQEVLPI